MSRTALERLRWDVFFAASPFAPAGLPDDTLPAMSQIPASYVMGHDDRERRRLSLQASILNPLSDQLLRRAGLSAGLRVLDIGCGVGELSMVAARLVGRHGWVTGIDIDEAALALAAQRAREQGLDHISCTAMSAHTERTCRTTR